MEKPNYIPLLKELVIRDIKIKYRRSILGIMWTVLNPLLMMLVLYVVFSKLFRFDIENYAIYILSGQIIFNYYQGATTDSMVAVIGNAALIKKVYIPKYMLVLAKVLSGSVNLLASFAALIMVMLITGAGVPMTVLLCIIPILCVMIFSLGVGLILAAVTVRFRDIMHLYGVFCMALFYLTPVIYPISILPDYIVKIVSYNPLTGMIQVFRMLIMEGRIPAYMEFVCCAGWALFLLLAGGVIFFKCQDSFILNI